MKNQKRESIIVKIYLVVLFFAGIALFLSLQPSKNEKISADVALDRKVIDVLLANGISQKQLVSQYVREKSAGRETWNEFHKTFAVRDLAKARSLETGLAGAARSSKVGLRKTENPDGSLTYVFYTDRDKIYSQITFKSN